MTEAAQTYQQQTVTADPTNPGAIDYSWITAGAYVEVELHVTTDAEDVELVSDVNDTTGITCPAGETNYPAGRWQLGSNDKPSHVYAAVADNVQITISVFR